jgi:beta-fructofuranosidase
LKPDRPYDAELGCWSGTAAADGKGLALLYTGARKTGKPAQQVCLAQTADGKSFRKHAQNPVIPGPPAGFGDDFRDPKLWREGPIWKALVGSSRKGKGCVLLYHSADLRAWEYQGVFAESEGGQGTMWECPDFFPLGGKEVLLFSPIGAGGVKTLALVGKRDGSGRRFRAEAQSRVDFGPDFYAPQTWLDGKGRRLVLGWLGNWAHKETPSGPFGWRGAMSFPRTLGLRKQDLALASGPAQEMERLRGRPIKPSAGTDRMGWTSLGESEALDLEAELEVPSLTSGVFEIQVRRSDDGRAAIRLLYEAAKDRVTLDRTSLDQGPKDPAEVPGNRKGSRVHLRLVLDRSSLELFTGKPSASPLSAMIFPRPEDRSVKFRAAGGIKVRKLTAWPLKG